jgi:hypothetical protein
MVVRAGCDGIARERKRRAMIDMRFSSRAVRASLAKRLMLGLLMAMIAIVSGWFLSPKVGTDKATQEWYTQ